MIGAILALSILAIGETPDPPPIVYDEPNVAWSRVPDPPPIVWQAEVVKTTAAAGPLHSHQCPRCGSQWSHGDDQHGIAQSHRCPSCGYGPVWQVHSRNVGFTVPASVPYRPSIPSRPVRAACPT